MIDKETKEMSPVPAFLDISGLVRICGRLTMAARGKWSIEFHDGLALLSITALPCAVGVHLYELFKKFDKSFGLTGKDTGS